MEVRRRRLWPWAGLVLLVVFIAVVGVFIVRAADPKSASTLVGTLVGLATTACTVAGWLWARRPSQTSRVPVARVADALAERVYRQWERAASERRLVYPAPIPLRWRWSRQPVTGPVSEAVGGAGGTRLSPVPGMATITAERLQSGALQDLLEVYGGLDSGRLVIVGGAGAGKTSAAIRLLLDALRHRAAVGTLGERARVPVPVLVTLQGWDPDRERFADWLANRLTRDYELFTAREYGPNAAARLIDGGYLTAILDGLDEIPKMLRPVVVRALDEQATFRLIVLTRRDELVAAVSEAHLVGAAAVELCPVEPGQVADYLARCQIDSLFPAWQRVVEDLRDRPGGILAQALDTPLMVALIRDTYRCGNPVDELLDSSRFPSREAIEGHLLDRVLPVAYARHPGRPVPPCTAEEARRWLGSLARQMNNDEGTPDLAWWQIPRWVPAWPRALVIGLVVGLVGCFSGLVGGFVLGLVGVLSHGLRYTLVDALLWGLAYGLVFGLGSILGEGYYRQLGWRPWNRTDTRRALVFGLVAGLVSECVSWAAGGLIFGSTVGLIFNILLGLVTVLVAATAFWILTRLAVRLAVPSVEAASSLDPRSLWRRERRLGLTTGLVFGLTAWLLFGIMNGLACGLVLKAGLTASLVAGVVGGLANALPFGLGAMVASSTTWAATLASAQLRYRGETPAHLLNFLEDAHAREVLRCVGPVYQFRHARLQDRLAGAGRGSASPTSTADRARSAEVLSQVRRLFR